MTTPTIAWYTWRAEPRQTLATATTEALAAFAERYGRPPSLIASQTTAGVDRITGAVYLAIPTIPADQVWLTLADPQPPAPAPDAFAGLPMGSLSGASR